MTPVFYAGRLIGHWLKIYCHMLDFKKKKKLRQRELVLPLRNLLFTVSTSIKLSHGNSTLTGRKSSLKTKSLNLKAHVTQH